MKKYIISALIVCATMFLASCSDNEDWQPGEEVNSAGVFFREQPKYAYTIEADDSRIIPVSLGRIKSDEDITVPLKVVSCPEGVKVPESVFFEAGSDNATFDIDLTDMPSKTSGDIQIAVDPSFTSPYGAGASSLSLNITVTGAWLLLADDVKVDYDGAYPEHTTQLFFLEGTDRFKLPNFANSGVDLIFTLSSKTDDYPDVIPYTNVRWYTEVYPDYEDEYNCWYLFNTKEKAYPVWSPDGSEPMIKYAMFYGNGYSWLSLNTGTAGFTASADMTDGSNKWLYVNLTFKLLFDPFSE